MSPLSATRSCRQRPDSVRVDRLGTVDYLTGWDMQRALASARRAGSGPDVLMLLEHSSVYTAGKRTPSEDRPTDGTPVIDVDRGGLITWHGPGQLVGYPIIALAEPPTSGTTSGGSRKRSSRSLPDWASIPRPGSTGEAACGSQATIIVRSGRSQRSVCGWTPE